MDERCEEREELAALERETTDEARAQDEARRFWMGDVDA